MSQQRAAAIATLAVVLVAGITCCLASSEVLKCGVHCTCSVETKDVLLEYRVICNATGSQAVKLTDDIFAGKDTYTVLQSYVRVEDSAHVTVTEEFLKSWKEFGSCSLDVWRVSHLVFDKAPLSPTRRDDWHHVFAGIGISDSTLDELPNGLLGGKLRAGLLLTRSHVGHIHHGVFGDTPTLKYMNVEDSHIGILRGSREAKILEVEKNEEVYPIRFHNSVIGQIESGALNVTSNAILVLMLDTVTIGQLQTEGIVVSGLNLVLTDSKVADMQSKALKSLSPGTITVKNSYLIAQPGALNHLQCNFYKHNINSNEFLLPHGPPKVTEAPSSEDDNNGTTSVTTNEKTSIVSLFSEALSTVLHHSCITHNLPKWAINSNCQRVPNPPQLLRQSSKVLHIGMYSFIGISIIAIIVIVVLTCVLISTRGRRSVTTVDSPTVIMSNLQDPVYEEVSTYLLPNPQPPAVPPPVKDSSYPNKGNTDSNNCCSATLPRGACGDDTSFQQKQENFYITMR